MYISILMTVVRAVLKVSGNASGVSTATNVLMTPMTVKVV